MMAKSATQISAAMTSADTDFARKAVSAAAPAERVWDIGASWAGMEDVPTVESTAWSGDGMAGWPICPDRQKAQAGVTTPPILDGRSAPCRRRLPPGAARLVPVPKRPRPDGPANR